MIDELEVRRYDKRFGTKSKVFYNVIAIDSGIDEWRIEITNRRTKGVRLLHKSRFGRKNKFHIQGFRTNLFQAYHSIYSHKHVLECISKRKV